MQAQDASELLGLLDDLEEGPSRPSEGNEERPAEDLLALIQPKRRERRHIWARHPRATAGETRLQVRSV